MFNFTAIGNLTHKMENILDRLRNSQMEVTKPIIDLLLQGLDALKCLLDAAHGGDAADEEGIKALENELVACFNGGTSETNPRPAQSKQEMTSQKPRSQHHLEWYQSSGRHCLSSSSEGSILHKYSESLLNSVRSRNCKFRQIAYQS